MGLPDRTTIRSYAGSAVPTYLTATLPDYWVSGQTVTVATASGWYEIYPDGTQSSALLGSSGPFTIVVDYGLVTEEKILCSSIISVGSIDSTISIYSTVVS